MVSHRKPAKPAFDPRTVKENIVETPLNEEMSKSFLEYAYSVIYARALPDARDGLKLLEEHEIKLVIIDTMMPEIDGFEMCRRIRIEKNIPIIRAPFSFIFHKNDTL